jgi:pyruvate,water dikinase
VRRAWAALWSEPVVACRQQLGSRRGDEVGGGVVLQRMVPARASGVLFTASPAANAGQMVLNVGLGLGEGVVSGLTEVDLVIIERPRLPTDPLDLDYKVADKRHRVVLAPESSQRTQVTSVPYHQRLRPALEFVEIQELVAAALQLEAALHHPLDVEFALEGAEFHVLQVRPVPVFHASLASPVLRRAAAAPPAQGDPS